MTSEKSPKVIMVRGRPRIFRMGETIRFRMPRTIANTIAVENPSKCTPERILVRKNATTAVTRSRMIKFLVYRFIV